MVDTRFKFNVWGLGRAMPTRERRTARINPNKKESPEARGRPQWGFWGSSGRPEWEPIRGRLVEGEKERKTHENELEK